MMAETTKDLLGTTEMTKMCSGARDRLERSSEVGWYPRKASEDQELSGGGGKSQPCWSSDWAGCVSTEGGMSSHG